jgi:hypothetical protein
VLAAVAVGTTISAIRKNRRLKQSAKRALKTVSRPMSKLKNGSSKAKRSRRSKATAKHR